jgi:hypothetical protein
MIDLVSDLQAAHEHARKCMEARNGWTVETLGQNIESNFPDLDPEVCDEVAVAALWEDA